MAKYRKKKIWDIGHRKGKVSHIALNICPSELCVQKTIEGVLRALSIARDRVRIGRNQRYNVTQRRQTRHISPTCVVLSALPTWTATQSYRTLRPDRSPSRTSSPTGRKPASACGWASCTWTATERVSAGHLKASSAMASPVGSIPHKNAGVWLSW